MLHQIQYVLSQVMKINMSLAGCLVRGGAAENVHMSVKNEKAKASYKTQV